MTKATSPVSHPIRKMRCWTELPYARRGAEEAQRRAGGSMRVFFCGTRSGGDRWDAEGPRDPCQICRADGSKGVGWKKKAKQVNP